MRGMQQKTQLGEYGTRMMGFGKVDDDELDWAVRCMEALDESGGFEDFEEPEPPESIMEERRQRRYDDKARRAVARAIHEGLVERVPIDNRCIGLGPVCAVCGDKLPEPGDPPKRCTRRSD